MRAMIVVLIIVAIAASPAVPQTQDLPIFEQVFHSLYPNWWQMGARYAQVFPPSTERLRLFRNISVSPAGGGVENLSVPFPIPPNTPHQIIHHLWPSHDDYEIIEARDGQKTLMIFVGAVNPGETVVAGWEVEAEISHIIHPMDTLEQCVAYQLIPPEIHSRYTEDHPVYGINTPIVQEAATFVLDQVHTYPEAVWIAYDLISSEISYDHERLADPASGAEALDWGVGVCRHFSWSMIALCRAMGIPARHVSGAVIGGSELHAWPEVYFPEYGWVSSDPTWGRRSSAHRARRFGTLDSRCLVLTVGIEAREAVSRWRYRHADRENPAQLEIEQMQVLSL